ncbi:MAG: GNAT family N-acetyltransferase [Pseudomonadota bacterium]
MLIEPQLRGATIADARAMSALVETLLADWLVPDGNPQALSRLQQIHRPAMMARNINDGYRYWLAETADTELIGFVALKPPAHLFNLYVREDWHGRGVGALLWRQLQQTVLAAAGSCITVNASERAIPVYRRWGFVETEPLQCHDGLRFQPMCWRAACVA